jgi:hypothetical protein
MELKDIKNKATLRQIERLKIDITQFSEYKDLTRHIRLINVRANQAKYLKENPDYYRNYMRDKYRKKIINEKGTVRIYTKKSERNNISFIEKEIARLQEQLEKLKVTENP